MQSPSSQTDYKLPDVRIIGFTGHRHLKNPKAVASALRLELAALKAKDGELIAVSSVAIGADTIFAQEVLQAGIKWIVILPMPREIFKDDFSAGDWAIAEGLIKQAAEVQVLRGSERPQCYFDAGKMTVDDSDSLLAVWDGKPAQGPGGTAEIVAYAKMLEREVTEFRESEAGVEKVDPSKVVSLEFKPEQLLKMIGPRPELPPPPQMLVNYFKDCDKKAMAACVRRDSLRKAALHLAATFVAVLSLAMDANRVPFPTIYMATTKVLLVSLALWLVLSLRRSRKHETWLHQRLAAEYCRSVLATWHCREPIEPVSFHEVPELKALAQFALLQRLNENQRDPVDFHTFRAAYAHDRVLDQMEYFRSEADRAEAKAGPLRTHYWFYTFAAVVFSILLLVFRFWVFPAPKDDVASSSWLMQAIMVILDVSPLALPALASFTSARMAIDEVNRRIERFRDLQIKMRIALVDLSLCSSWESLCRSVARTEKILFNEVLEWYSISRFSATE